MSSEPARPDPPRGRADGARGGRYQGRGKNMTNNHCELQRGHHPEVGRGAGAGRTGSGRQLFVPGRHLPPRSTASFKGSGNQHLHTPPLHKADHPYNADNSGTSENRNKTLQSSGQGRGAGPGRGRGRQAAGRHVHQTLSDQERQMGLSQFQTTDWPSLPTRTTQTRQSQEREMHPIRGSNQTEASSKRDQGSAVAARNLKNSGLDNAESLVGVTKRESQAPVAKGKTKKPRPMLKTMCLGDVLTKPNVTRGSPKKVAMARPIPLATNKGTSSGRAPEPSSKSLALTRLAAAEDRISTGEEHAFIRLAKEGNIKVTHKGRQRVRPRTKRFTSLKKKVLQERLEQWRKLNPDVSKMQEGVKTSEMDNEATSILVYNFIKLNDLQDCDDEDEYDEFVVDLRDLAMKVGPVKFVHIPRHPVPWAAAEGKHPCFVEFERPNDASAARACWSGMVVGGEQLDTLFKEGAPGTEDDWVAFCVNGAWTSNQDAASTKLTTKSSLVEVAVENVLTEDDLEDEDCLQESIADLRAMAEQYGSVVDVIVDRTPTLRVVVHYQENLETVHKAVAELNNKVISGSSVSAHIVENNDLRAIIIRNVLTEDDLEDEDCLEESMNDMRELASQFGSIVDMALSPDHGETALRIVFSSMKEKEAALKGFKGMKIGGSSVSAHALIPSGDFDTQPTERVTSNGKDELSPMFSGDKLIPERYAECKRVPKIANPGTPRHYATLASDPVVKQMLSDMLEELSRLQKRALDDKNSKARRRLVMGLREVARGIRAHKVKMVVMANNLDEYGAIDEKLQEIIDLCIREEVPIFFEFNKRGLGKAVGKSIKVAVVGIQNADGAHQHFKKLMNFANIPTRPSRSV